MTDSSESFEEYSELSWAQPEEKPKPLASEEPFRPDMILIPVLCSACRLRIYVQEKHIGLWTVCPDCGRLNEIRPADPMTRQVVVDRGGGMYELRPVDAQEKPAQTVQRRYNVDYRTVEGAVDARNETIPFYGLDETSSDELENKMDRLIEKNPDKRLSDAEKKYRRTLEESVQQKNAEKKQREKESTEERQKRLIEDLNRQKSNRTRITSGNAVPQPPQNFPKRPSGSAAVPLSGKSPNFDQNPVRLQEGMEREQTPLKRKKSPIQRLPSKGGFWNILCDERNFRRFFLLGLFGFAAFTVFLTLDFYLTAVFFPAANTAYSFFIFYGLYLCAAVPLALWGILLLMTGMTIFDASRDGLSTIQRWIPFRVEFALQYLGTFLIINWTAPFPGTILGIILTVTGWGNAIFPSGGMAIQCFGTLSLLLFGPVLFLSIVENDRGIALYHRRIWGSLIHRFGTWLRFYAAGLFFLILLAAVWTGAVFVLHWTIERKYLLTWPIHLGLGAVLSLATEMILLILFRLLGRHARRLNRGIEE